MKIILDKMQNLTGLNTKLSLSPWSRFALRFWTTARPAALSHNVAQTSEFCLLSCTPDFIKNEVRGQKERPLDPELKVRDVVVISFKSNNLKFHFRKLNTEQEHNIQAIKQNHKEQKPTELKS